MKRFIRLFFLALSLGLTFRPYACEKAVSDIVGSSFSETFEQVLTSLRGEISDLKRLEFEEQTKSLESFPMDIFVEFIYRTKGDSAEMKEQKKKLLFDFFSIINQHQVYSDKLKSAANKIVFKKKRVEVIKAEENSEETEAIDTTQDSAVAAQARPQKTPQEGIEEISPADQSRPKLPPPPLLPQASKTRMFF